MATTRMLTRPEGDAPCRAKGHDVASWRVGTVLSVLVAALLTAPGASAQAIRITPTIAIEETLTNNVRLFDSADARSDLVSQITPGFTVDAKGARTSLIGSVAVPMLVYARSGAELNRVYPTVNLVGNVEALERLFFIDSAVNVSQQYLTPFAARPSSLSTVTSNRYTAESYTVSPYFKGATQGNITYELRDTNNWLHSYGGATSTNDSYTNELVVRLAKAPVPWGWSTDFDRSSVKFPGQDALVTQIGRVQLSRDAGAQLEVFAGTGYEDDHYTFSKFRDVTYRIGGRWRPTERMTVVGDWEHRFFGSAYHFNLDNRTPLSVWQVSASRDISTFPQQLGGLSQGLNITSYLNQLFLTSVPDPLQRAALIAQIIQGGGLPLFLPGGVNLYSQQATIQQSATASFGLLGARNTLFFTGYHLRTDAVGGTAVPILGFSSAVNNSQLGGGIAWTHKFSPSLSLNTTADWLRAESLTVGKTTQETLRLTLTSPVSVNTSLYGGGRYQRFRSDISLNYSEAALIFGLIHTFH